MIRSRLLQAACCSLLTAHCWLAGCMQQRKSAWLAVAGSTAACTTCNKSGHRRTAANWRHLIASHVGPSETEREMPQNGTEQRGEMQGKEGTSTDRLLEPLIYMSVCVCVCVCTYAKLYLTDLRDKPSRPGRRIDLRLKWNIACGGAASGANDSLHSSQIGSQLKMKPSTRKGTCNSNGSCSCTPNCRCSWSRSRSWPVP